MTKPPGPPVDSEGRCQNVDWLGRLCGQVHDPSRCQGHIKATGRPDHPLGGKQCTHWPVKGLEVCDQHGARNAQARAAGQRNVEMAKVERTVIQKLEQMGEDVGIVHDGQLLVAMRDLAARKVLLYGRLVAQLRDDELHFPLYHHSGQETGESKPNIVIVMHDAERDRAAKLDEICVKLGFEARRELRADTEVAQLLDCVNRAGRVLPPELREAYRVALVAEIRALQPAV